MESKEIEKQIENLIKINEPSDIVAYWAVVLLQGDNSELIKFHLVNGYNSKNNTWKVEESFLACCDFIKMQIKYPRPGRGSGIGLDFIGEEIQKKYPSFSIK